VTWGSANKTLGSWVRKHREQQALDALPGALSEHERLELKRLRKEVAELKVEREILRKAAAYFAKETTR
jgi:transposase